jgi:integrase
MALTDTEIRKAKAKEQPYRMTDGGGLHLYVTPAGGRLWRWKYRYDGLEKLMSFGKYPDVSLATARELHAEQRRLLAAGTDPMAQRKAEKRGSAENSFERVASLWLAHWEEGKSPRHAAYVRRRLEADILPFLGSKPLTEIEAPELVKLAKTIQDRGARDIAKRALETIGQIFRYGIAHGYAKRNAAKDFRPSDVLKSTRKVNYARVDPKELPALLRAIDVYQGTHITRLAMKLMALTFVRTGELIGGRWSEIDIESARWNIPLERMKMRQPHIVALSRQALEVLEALQPLSGSSEWLFPGDRMHRRSKDDGNQAKPISNNTILAALKRMGYQGTMLCLVLINRAAVTVPDHFRSACAVRRRAGPGLW